MNERGLLGGVVVGPRRILRLVWAGVALVLALAHARSAAANPVLLFEPETGVVLHAEAQDHSWHPASVTKLMTAYVVFEALRNGELAWDSDVPLSETARAQPATRIGLRGGIRINVEQAVRGLILRSANDFATALAERVSGTETGFVQRMNATAKRLEMSRTVFRNPHGLPDQDQVTTARDLARLTTALLADFPDRAEVFSTPTVRIHKGTFHSQNDLLRTFTGADGLKTGFTCASGYNVVASATREGRTLVAIVLGATDRQQRSARASALLESGFQHLFPGTGGVTLTSAPAIPPEGGAVAAPPPVVRTFAPVPITPVAFAALTLADEHSAPDIARSLKSRKCRGYGGLPSNEPDLIAADEPPVGRAAAALAAKASPGATVMDKSAAAPAKGVKRALLANRKAVRRVDPATVVEPPAITSAVQKRQPRAKPAAKSAAKSAVPKMSATATPAPATPTMARVSP